MHFRKVYWTDWGVVPKIERINFDGNGSSRETLVNKSIWWPTGLAIDHFNNRLYWSDTKLKHFESINLDGTGREVVKKFSNCKIVYIVYHFLPQVNTFLKLYTVFCRIHAPARTPKSPEGFGDSRICSFVFNGGKTACSCVLNSLK